MSDNKSLRMNAYSQLFTFTSIFLFSHRKAGTEPRHSLVAVATDYHHSFHEVLMNYVEMWRKA